MKTEDLEAASPSDGGRQLSAEKACSCGCGVTEVQTVVSTLVSVPAEETRTTVATGVETTLTDVHGTLWVRNEQDKTLTFTVPELVTRTETLALVLTTLTETQTVVTRAETFVPVLTTAAFTETVFARTEPVFGVTETETVVTRLTETVETVTVPEDPETTVVEKEILRAETFVEAYSVPAVAERVVTRETAVFDTATKLMKTGWIPAGTVITLSGVDDAASIMLDGEPVASCSSNGEGPPDFVAGECSFTVLRSGFHTIGIGNHVNWGGPSSEGSLSLAPPAECVETVVEYQERRTAVVSATETTVVWNDATREAQRTVTELTQTVAPVPGTGTGERVETVKAFTEITGTETRAATYLAGERVVTEMTETETVVSYEGDVRTRLVTETTATDVLTQTDTLVEIVRHAYTDTVTETETRVVEWILVPTVTRTLITLPTATVTAWTVPAVTLTETALMVAAETRVPCTCVSHACVGGIYVGTAPVEHAHWGEDVAAVRCASAPDDAHRFIF